MKKKVQSWLMYSKHQMEKNFNRMLRKQTEANESDHEQNVQQNMAFLSEDKSTRIVPQLGLKMIPIALKRHHCQQNQLHVKTLTSEPNKNTPLKSNNETTIYRLGM